MDTLTSCAVRLVFTCQQIRMCATVHRVWPILSLLMTTSSRRDRDDFGWWPPTVGLIANNRYSEQKSAQLSPEDACSVRQSNTLGFISVTNSHTYSVTSLKTICVDVIKITVALTQFIKSVLLWLRLLFIVLLYILSLNSGLVSILAKWLASKTPQRNL